MVVFCTQSCVTLLAKAHNLPSRFALFRKITMLKGSLRVSFLLWDVERNAIMTAQPLQIKLDFTRYMDNRLDVIFEGTSPRLVFEAIAAQNGITVENLTITDTNAQPIDYTVDDDVISIDADQYVLQYTLHTQYDACVGADRNYYLIYPFMNPDEICLGSGAIPYPQGELLPYEFQVKKMPPEFGVFSNLEPMHPEKVGTFFLYASRHQNIERFTYQYAGGNTLQLSFLTQHNVTLPFELTTLYAFLHNWLAFLEKHIGSYQRTKHINCLVLQAPHDFEQQANNRTFATGENMLNGIVTYAPSSAAYLHKQFGHDDYEYFLYDGFTHELGHLYTSAGNSTQKCILYATPDCPSEDRMLIGEALNGYVHELYMHHAYHQDMQRFYNVTLPSWLEHERRHRLKLKWFLMDVALHTKYQSSVWQLFEQMVTNHPGTYREASDLIPYPDLLELQVTSETVQTALQGLAAVHLIPLAL